MDDLIYRQDAIDQLHQSINILEAEDRLKELPSAERKKGEWILTKNDIWCCSECAAMAPYYYMSEKQKKSRYCYICGARMEKGEADE